MRTTSRRAPALLRTLLLPAALVLGALAVLRTSEAAPPPHWDYRVTVAPNLASLRVRLCFRGFVPRRVWLADGSTLQSIHIVSTSGARLEPDPTQGETLLVLGMADGGCLEYTVDLKAVEAVGGAEVASGYALTHLGSWMLRGGIIPPDLVTTVAFDLPEGYSVSTPWTRIGPGSYRADASTWPFLGHAVFGRLETDKFEVAGCPVELVRLPGALRTTPAGLKHWITTAMLADTTLFHGRFPAPRLLVIVDPSEGSGVTFGSAWYGGGSHAILDLGSGTKDEELPGEWVAVHELLHTCLPMIARDDAWLGEGFVTYYQEVLRARGGIQSPAQAFSELDDGFRRGRASSDSPRSIDQDSREMHRRHEYLRVYWAGAAIALLLDVDLRRATNGRFTLDDVMRGIHRCPGAGLRSLPASEIIAEVDRVLREPRFSRLAAPLLASSSFPAVESVYPWLGLQREADGKITFIAGAPGAAVRDAIMAKPAPTPSATVPAAVAPGVGAPGAAPSGSRRSP